MSLRQKLLLALLPLGAALALVGVLASMTILSLGRRSGEILKDNHLSILCTQRLYAAVEHLHGNAIHRVLDGSVVSAAAALTRAESELRTQENNITEPGEAEASRRLREAWEEYRRRLEELEHAGAGELQHFFLQRLEPALGSVRASVDTIRGLNQDAIVRKSEHARREAERMNRIMMAGSAVALLIGAFLSVNLTNRLLRPLELLTRTVNRIGEGDFDSRVDIEGSDELAQLANDVNAMAKRLGQYRRSSLGDLLLAQQAAQAAIDSLPDPVIIFDLNADVLNANRAAEAELGVHVSTSQQALERLEGGVRAAIERVRAHVLMGKGAYAPRGFDEAVRVTTSDGEQWLLPSATPVYTEHGNIQGAAVVLHDVTRLRRVDELRDDLVATLAHEFRTPLTSLQLAIHLLIDQTAGQLTEKQLDLVYAARSDCDRLQAMVNDILDLSRIQSGRIEMHPAPASVKALVRDAVEAHRGVAAERGVTLSGTASLVDDEVLVDRDRVALVIANLVTNAVRHTAHGGSVLIQATATDGAVRVAVVDTGSGIPAEHQRAIFDKFVRLPGEGDEGAGLGLSIAKDIIAAHGGSIGVDSQPGHGSTFWFTLPRAPQKGGER